LSTRKKGSIGFQYHLVEKKENGRQKSIVGGEQSKKQLFSATKANSAKGLRCGAALLSNSRKGGIVSKAGIFAMKRKKRRGGRSEAGD